MALRADSAPEMHPTLTRRETLSPSPGLAQLRRRAPKRRPPRHNRPAARRPGRHSLEMSRAAGKRPHRHHRSSKEPPSRTGPHARPARPTVPPSARAPRRGGMTVTTTISTRQAAHDVAGVTMTTPRPSTGRCAGVYERATTFSNHRLATVRRRQIGGPLNRRRAAASENVPTTTGSGHGARAGITPGLARMALNARAGAGGAIVGRKLVSFCLTRLFPLLRSAAAPTGRCAVQHRIRSHRRPRMTGSATGQSPGDPEPRAPRGGIHQASAGSRCA
jgi:hypothetical protein